MTLSAQQVPADSVRAALRDVFAAREYDWQEPHHIVVRLLEWAGRVLAWFDRLQAEHPVAYWALIAAMILTLIAIFAHGAVVYSRSVRRLTRGAGGARTAANDIHDARWHLREAQRLSAAGHYTEALGHRFVALVLELEEARALRFHPSKTPAEYIAEARVDDSARATLAGLVATLYRHLFGGTPCTEDDWAGFDRQAGEVTSRAVA